MVFLPLFNLESDRAHSHPAHVRTPVALTPGARRSTKTADPLPGDAAGLAIGWPAWLSAESGQAWLHADVLYSTTDGGHEQQGVDLLGSSAV
jgi:hypothetical protein